MNNSQKQLQNVMQQRQCKPTRILRGHNYTTANPRFSEYRDIRSDLA